MKRVGGLWPDVVSFSNLLRAAEKAAAGKRTRTNVASFLMNLEGELLRLQRELIQGSYVPGPYRSFRLQDPKPRLISAAPFRDRVVHHALTGVVEPIFERRFSSSSFACRLGMGTHAAILKARQGARNFPYVLKCDVRKYFASIDHEILKNLLSRVVKCAPTLDLATRIIDGSNLQQDTAAYFPGDNLFTPYERRRGLPLGNQTSQFFANVYLNPLDQLLERQWQPGAYARYVDDLVVFDNSLERLRDTRDAIRGKLWDLRLDLHPSKSRIYRVADGVTFLGWRIFPRHARLVRPNVIRFRRRMRRMQARYATGGMMWKEIEQGIRAWLAHAAHGETWSLRANLLNEFSFTGGRRTI
ncbi:MAG: reverse transcriptase/maturase family protein [Bryobacteraceae bacterium]